MDAYKFRVLYLLLEDYFEFLTNGGEDDDIPKEALPKRSPKDENNGLQDIAHSNGEVENSDNEVGLDSTESNTPNEEQIHAFGKILMFSYFYIKQCISIKKIQRAFN